MMFSKKVFRMEGHWYRSDFEGVFVATEEEVERLKTVDLYFGEIAGKHSDVMFEAGEVSYEIISHDPVLVAWVESLNGFGLRPWDGELEE